VRTLKIILAVLFDQNLLLVISTIPFITKVLLVKFNRHRLKSDPASLFVSYVMLPVSERA